MHIARLLFGVGLGAILVIIAILGERFPKRVQLTGLLRAVVVGMGVMIIAINLFWLVINLFWLP